MGFGAFMIIGYVVLRFNDTGIYSAVVNPLDLTALAAAFAGACMGFLWFNAAPARIIMGDIGALALGSALSLLALTTNTQLLLLLICGINVMEAGSVALQMAVFKASGRTRRLFRMSPIHHHFELIGWPETTVIIRFWLIAAVCVAAALGIFIADFTRVATYDRHCVPRPRMAACWPLLGGARRSHARRGDAMTVLVYGLAVTGAATVRALQARDIDVLAADDRRAPRPLRSGVRPRRRARGRARRSSSWHGSLAAVRHRRAGTRRARGPSCRPRPPSTPGRRVVTELELAYEWEQ